MKFANRKYLAGTLVAGLLGVSSVGSASAEPKLDAYNAPITESSISGISSGAFMAVQFGVAWSSQIKGIGVVAGGPYYCADGNLLGNAWTGGWEAIFAALYTCMAGSPGDLSKQFAEADAKAASQDIDPLGNLDHQKIYIFHGYNDSVVSRPVTDATESFFEHYVAAGERGNIYYQTALGAGHSFVVLGENNRKLDSCPANKSPYIDQCGYDQAGIMLQHIYGALNPPAAGPLGGVLKSFDQSAYTGDDIPDALSLGDTGYVYVPKDCEAGASCRVHVALHGCLQDAGSIQKTFVEDTGYNRWADANRIIVLYPQAKVSAFSPINPQACWDWWGYVNYDDSYVTKSGKQIKAIKAMLDAVTAGAANAAPVAAPFMLVVNDASDSAVALAWTAAPGATAYRVFRSSGGGAFRPVADVAGLSFADNGLPPNAAFSWRISPLVNGAEQAPSNAVAATTLTTPAACNSPGSCPLAALTGAPAPTGQ